MQEPRPRLNIAQRGDLLASLDSALRCTGSLCRSTRPALQRSLAFLCLSVGLYWYVDPHSLNAPRHSIRPGATAPNLRIVAKAMIQCHSFPHRLTSADFCMNADTTFDYLHIYTFYVSSHIASHIHNRGSGETKKPFHRLSSRHEDPSGVVVNK